MAVPNINYNAGFLPQNLYQNLIETQRQGLAERNRREMERARGVGGLLGSVAQMDTGRSGEAEKDFLTKRDAELTRMKDGLSKINPRLEPELYEQQQKRISDFERGSQAAMDKFKDSGFLGLGRDRDALQLPEFERKAEGFDSAGVTEARGKQKQMVGAAQAIRDKASKQFQDRGQETTDRLLDAYDLEEQGDTTDASGYQYRSKLKQAQEEAEKAQGAEGVAEGFLKNRDRYLQGVKGDAQQQLDDALAQQEDDRADKIYNPELGVYQSRESYKPIADYEEQFDKKKREGAIPFEKVSINGVETTLDEAQRGSLMKTIRDRVRFNTEAGLQKIKHTDDMGFTREITINEFVREEGIKDKLAEYDQQLTSAQIQKLARMDDAEVDRLVKRLPRIEAVQKKIDLDRFADFSKAKREEKILDAFDEAYEIQPMMRDALRAELNMKSEVELNAFMKRFKQESGLTLEADLKKMGAVAELKRKIQKETLADTDLTDAQRAKQIGDILAVGGAELSLKVSEMVSRSGVDIETARRKIVELGPLETQQLVDRINKTKDPEAQAAALKAKLVGEATAAITRNAVEQNLSDKYGVSFSESGQMLDGEGNPVNLMDLEAEFTDKQNNKKTVRDTLINMAKNASSMTEIADVKRLVRANGFSVAQTEAFGSFAKQNKGLLETDLKKAALTSPAFTPEQQFSIAQDLGIIKSDVKYVDVKGQTEFIERLIDKGIDVPEGELNGTVFEGNKEQVQALVSESRVPRRKEGILRNLNAIMETMVDEPSVGQQNYREYVDKLSPEDQKLVVEMGYSQNVMSTSAAKLLLDKTRTDQKLNNEKLGKIAERKLKLAQASYYDAQTKTEGGDIEKIRAKSLFDGIARIFNNKDMFPEQQKEAIKGLRKNLDPNFGKKNLEALEKALEEKVDSGEKIDPPENPPSKERLEPPKFTKPQTPVSSRVEQIFTSANPAMRERLQLTQTGAFKANTILDRFVGEFSENGRTANTMMELISGAGGVEELAKKLANASDPLNEAKELMQNMGRSSTHLSTPMKAQLNAIAEGYRALKPSPTTDMGFLP